MDKWLKNFLLLVCTLAITSYLFISWAQSQMPQVQTVTLTTEIFEEYQKFQRDCLKKVKLGKTDVVLKITIYYREIRTWRLTCQWGGSYE